MKSAQRELVLRVLREPLSIVRLAPDESVPAWIEGGSWCSTTRTPDELSVVCEARVVPPGVSSTGPWRALQVEGPLDFALTGILSRIAEPLARAGISIFAVSTYDTDYVLVRERDIGQAVACLTGASMVVHAAD